MNARLLVSLVAVAAILGGCARPPAVDAPSSEQVAVPPVAETSAVPPCEAARTALGQAIGTAEYLLAHPIGGMEGALDHAIAALRVVAPHAPPDRQADVGGIVRVLAGVSAAVADQSRSAADVASKLHALAPVVHAPGFRDAVARVQTWLGESCG